MSFDTRTYALAVGVAECDACHGTGRKPGSPMHVHDCEPCEGTGNAGAERTRTPTSDGDRVPMMRRKVPRHLEAPPKENA